MLKIQHFIRIFGRSKKENVSWKQKCVSWRPPHEKCPRREENEPRKYTCPTKFLGNIKWEKGDKPAPPFLLGCFNAFEGDGCSHSIPVPQAPFVSIFRWGGWNFEICFHLWSDASDNCLDFNRIKDHWILTIHPQMTWLSLFLFVDANFWFLKKLWSDHKKYYDIRKYDEGIMKTIQLSWAQKLRFDL